MFRFLVATAVLCLTVLGAHAEDDRSATLWKNPQCGCCEAYAEYLRENGFSVTVKPTHDLSLIKREHSVPSHLEGCHTTLIQGYVVEGHVPVRTLNKLLKDRPEIKGISLPGMPMGSPGMSGIKDAPFTIYQYSDDGNQVFDVD